MVLPGTANLTRAGVRGLCLEESVCMCTGPGCGCQSVHSCHPAAPHGGRLAASVALLPDVPMPEGPDGPRSNRPLCIRTQNVRQCPDRQPCHPDVHAASMGQTLFGLMPPVIVVSPHPQPQSFGYGTTEQTQHGGLPTVRI